MHPLCQLFPCSLCLSALLLLAGFAVLPPPAPPDSRLPGSSVPSAPIGTPFVTKSKSKGNACDLSRNYLTGPLVKLSGIKADLSNNYLSDGPSLVPTCLCGARSKQFGLLRCVPFTGATSRGILPPFTVLTKGTQQETVGKFAGKPVTLFIYPPGVTSRCGLELAFTVNFTFALKRHSGRAGPSGFAFVIAATAKAGKPGGVGYSGMRARSIAVTFDIKESHQGVGLNLNGRAEPVVSKVSPFMFTDGNSYTAWVDYEPGDPGTFRVFLASSNEKPEEPLLLQKGVSLCTVLQSRVKQQRAAFSFGFTASIAFQLHGILFSAVQTGKAILGRPNAHSLASVLIFRLVFSSTGAPASKAVQTKEQALGLSLSESTFAPSRASPFSRYVSADFKLSATRADSWSIRDFHTWDNVPFLNWPVKNQNDCNACWAYAVVASVEAAYGIAKQQSAPRLSVEGLFALMGLTDSDKCSAGGSPTQAFEMLTALDASSGFTGDSDPVTTYQVQAFERARFKGYVGLMPAVQRQPVVVHIEASPTFMLYDGTFKYQDPGCYTGNLNHVVLVIGYFITRNDGSQNRIAPPFWIIRNSWGEEWGKRGNMRMDIQGGDGVCGINVLPGIYPIIKTNTTATTMTVSGDNWWCSDVHPLVGLSLIDFTDQNIGIDCSQPMPKGSVLQLDGTSATPCTAFFYTLNGDTCAYISRRLNFTEPDLTALNPGLDCSKPIKAGRSVCIERSAAFAFTIPECVRYGTLTPQDTCERLLQRTGTSPGGVSAIENQWAALYRNNPGLTCSATIPSSASAVGSNIGVQVRTVRAGGKLSGMGEHGMVGEDLPHSRVLVVHDGDMQEG
ncbi:unnamed protein product [Closterium sp. NIES-64]|nr:unnamed protein product [Closterium sp. NIES-64]